MNEDKLIKDLHNALIKKAKGFYYSEETLEYVADAKPNKKQQEKQVSFFDFGGKMTNDEPFNIVDNIKNDKIKNNEKLKNNLKNSKKSVTKTLNCDNCDIEYGGKQKSLNDLDEGKCDEKCENGIDESEQSLTLSKKKITTHYVPPDMLAIKMLFEINSKALTHDYFNLTDEELLSKIDELKKELDI